MIKKYTVKIFAMAFFCLLLSITQITAQSTVAGGIAGTVSDQQGALIPGATVTATNTGTNARETRTTSDLGVYRFTSLQPGVYTVEVTMTGFSNFTSTNVLVEIGKVTTVNAKLTVGGANVEVTVDAPVINTISQDFANNIDETAISELPINGRRASNFVLLTPGVAPDGDFGLISFRGISGLLNNSTIDGGDNNQAFFSEERGRTRINYSISQDAVREFQVNTSNYSAEFGRAAGGVVNTVTKSGTNEFHGSVFYYLRDNEIGARNPFAFQNVAVPGGGTQIIGLKPTDRRHQFGGSIGGPVVRDKLFFFFSYDQQIRDFPGVAAPGSPTFLDPINVADPNDSQGVVLAGRGITQAQTDNALSFLRGLTGEVPRKGDQTLFLPKIDWVINENNNFSIVYNRLRWDSPGGVQTGAVVTRGIASFGNDLVDIDTLNARLNSSISPTVLNEFRFQYSRDFERQTGQAPGPGEPTTAPDGFPPDIGIAPGSGFDIGRPNFLPRTAFPEETRYQFADNVTILRGNHTIKFGADINFVNDVLDNLFRGGGEYRYNRLVDFITDFADPSQKAYSFFSQNFGTSRFEFSTTDYNFFVQDDIRISPTVVLNFGLRYEYQRLPEPQIPNPLEPRTANFPSDTNNFGPRLGFAIDVFGDGKTSVRSGWGIYYGRIINSTISNAISNTGVPGGIVGLFFRPNFGGSPEYPNTVPPPPPGGGGGGNIIVFNPDIENPLIHQADIVFEHTIARNTVVSVSGLLSIGRNLPTFIDTNLPAATGTTTYNVSGGPFDGQTFTVPLYTGSRPNPNFGAITEISSKINSQYWGLVLQLNRRLTDGLQFNFNYTWSDAEDNGQISQTFTTTNAPLDPQNLDFDYGTSNFDIPHRFVASLVYSPETIFGLGKDSSAGRAILGGWTFSPIVTLQSGRPYSADIGGNAPGGISGGVLGAGGDNRLPISERNSFRQPAIYNLDMRVSRRFNFSEDTNLEVLVEGFNIFNRTQITRVNTFSYFLVGNTYNFSSGFGTPTAAQNFAFRERQIQFAARFNF